MNQQALEQEWHKLQDRIDGMFGRFLKDDVPAIEHKSNVIALLQAPPEYMNSRQMDLAE